MLFCPTWKIFSAIVSKTSKIIRKSPSFHDFLSETLLRKCISRHVKSSFENPAKNFPVKVQVFLAQSPKKTKNQFLKSIFSKFVLSTLRLLFRHTWLFFSQNQKKTHSKSQKVDNSTNYFYHFFSKFFWGHVKCTLKDLPKVFCHKTVTFAQISKTIKQLLFSLLSRKNLKVFRCTRP